MGFRFRRTMQIVPGLRLNFSRSGPSVSFGPRGLHYTVGMKGTRATIGIPGSGLSWTSYQSYSSGDRSEPSGSAPPRASTPATSENVSAPDTSTRSFESADIEHLVAASTSELAPLLDAARKRWPYHYLALFPTAAMLVLAAAYELPVLAIAALVFGAVTWPIKASVSSRPLLAKTPALSDWRRAGA
jgi:hypothetical protein